jgi:Coenzyme PQQ synthesis protein D (PqqD)
MDVENSLRPRRSPMVVINDDLETPSLLDPLEGKIFITNRVGKVVMELADGTRTLDDITDCIVDRFAGAEKAVVRKEIEIFLFNSEKRGLVSWNRA